MDVVLGDSQVAHGLASGRIEQRAADELDRDGFFLLVLEVEKGIGGVAIDQLDAENLRVGERSADRDSEVGGGIRTLDLLFDRILDEEVVSDGASVIRQVRLMSFGGQFGKTYIGRGEGIGCQE